MAAIRAVSTAPAVAGSGRHTGSASTTINSVSACHCAGVPYARCPYRPQVLIFQPGQHRDLAADQFPSERVDSDLGEGDARPGRVEQLQHRFPVRPIRTEPHGHADIGVQDGGQTSRQAHRAVHRDLVAEDQIADAAPADAEREQAGEHCLAQPRPPGRGHDRVPYGDGRDPPVTPRDEQAR